jgi:ADP-ribose pyrophosphatase YjhB (NUDIX family)
MNLLKTIKDADFGFTDPAPAVYEERRASRAVVFDDEGKIALLYAAKKQFHKLPGGGIEEGETIADALTRELFEEIGCSVNNIRELGIIEEYRNRFKQHQLSYCYLADLDGSKGEPHFEEDEIADGFEPVWMSLEEATQTLEDEAEVEHYGGQFMRLRDVTFLKAAQDAM